MRPGFTLLELLIVLAVAGIIAGISVPALIGMRDRITVRMAAVDTGRAIADARSVALTASRRTAVQIDAIANTLSVVSGTDTIRTLHLDEYGVRMRTTLAVSRLGRIRRT